MQWFDSNLAVLSGLFVPLLLGVIGPLTSREAGGTAFRRIRRHAQLRSLLPDDGVAAKKLDALLESEIDGLVLRASTRLNRKLNGGNIAAIIFVSLVGGLVSFGLVSWAQASSGVLSWVIWIVFAGWSLLVLLLVLVGGLSNLYVPKESEEDK